MELRFRVGSRIVELVVSDRDGVTTVTVDGRPSEVGAVEIDDRAVSFALGGTRRRVLYDSERGHVFAASGGHAFEFVPGEEAAADRDGAGHFTPEISSPMPGKVLDVMVAVGDVVEADAALLLLEAMKMETTIRASHRSRVVEVRVAPAAMVGPGDVLVVLEEAPADDTD